MLLFHEVAFKCLNLKLCLISKTNQLSTKLIHPRFDFLTRQFLQLTMVQLWFNHGFGFFFNMFIFFATLSFWYIKSFVWNIFIAQKFRSNENRHFKDITPTTLFMIIVIYFVRKLIIDFFSMISIDDSLDNFQIYIHFKKKKNNTHIIYVQLMITYQTLKIRHFFQELASTRFFQIEIFHSKQFLIISSYIKVCTLMTLK